MPCTNAFVDSSCPSSLSTNSQPGGKFVLTGCNSVNRSVFDSARDAAKRRASSVPAEVINIFIVSQCLLCLSNFRRDVPDCFQIAFTGVPWEPQRVCLPARDEVEMEMENSLKRGGLV